MANIVDPYGYPVSSKLIQAAETNNQARPRWQSTLNDTKRDIPSWDWKTVVAYSRKLYANDGLMQGAINQMAQHVVGRAWSPHYMGEDKEWGKRAKAWLEDEWFPVCDVRGEQHDFKTNLFNASVALDVDGDFAAILTETEDGYPQTQHVPAHRIGQRDMMEKLVKAGPLKGRKIEQGLICNNFGRVIGVRVLGEAKEDDRDIISNDIIFCYNATRFDQVRGLPSFSHAINELRDAWQSQQWEQITHQAASAITFQEYTESGGEDPNDPAVTLGTQGTGNETVSTRTMDGGLIRIFKAGSGAKLEEFLSHKPTPAWTEFQDRIVRRALVGRCWPYSLTWKSDGLNGPAERSQIELARATILDRQELLSTVALREVRWALAKAAKAGRIPASADWWRWAFTLPPKFSIDNGRDGQSRREDYKLGHKNLRDILGEQGLDYAQHMSVRGEEIADLVKRAQDLSSATGVPFETVLNLFQQRSPNPIQMPQTTAPGRPPEPEPTDE